MNKKIIPNLLITFLLSSCAITPKQFRTDSRIRDAVDICMSAPRIRAELLLPDYVYNGEYRYGFNESKYNEFKSIQQKYPKEWESFKNKSKSNRNKYRTGEPKEKRDQGISYLDNVLLTFVQTIFSLGIAPIGLSLPAEDKKLTYPVLLSYCEKRMDEELDYYQKVTKPALQLQELKQKQKEEYEAQKQQKEQHNKVIETAHLLKLKGISSIRNGIYDSLYDLYNGKTNESMLKKAVIAFKPYSMDGTFRVTSINKYYAFYSNDSDIIAIKRSNNKYNSYLINSTLNGKYYQFTGTDQFNNAYGKNRLMVFREMWEFGDVSYQQMESAIGNK